MVNCVDCFNPQILEQILAWNGFFKQYLGLIPHFRPKYCFLVGAFIQKKSPTITVTRFFLFKTDSKRRMLTFSIFS